MAGKESRSQWQKGVRRRSAGEREAKHSKNFTSEEGQTPQCRFEVQLPMGSRPLKQGGEDCPGTLREVRRKRNGGKGRTRDCPLPLRMSRKAPGWLVLGDPRARVRAR